MPPKGPGAHTQPGAGSSEIPGALGGELVGVREQALH